MYKNRFIVLYILRRDEGLVRPSLVAHYSFQMKVLMTVVVLEVHGASMAALVRQCITNTLAEASEGIKWPRLLPILDERGRVLETSVSVSCQPVIVKALALCAVGIALL